MTLGGAAIGGGGMALTDYLTKGEVDPANAGVGALSGGMAGLGWVHNSRGPLRELDKGVKRFGDLEETMPKYFGKEKHRATMKALEDEVYNHGLNNYIDSGLIGSFQGAVPIAGAYAVSQAALGNQTTTPRPVYTVDPETGTPT